jgi:ABC-type amino acid transport substrate-binding protein
MYDTVLYIGVSNETDDALVKKWQDSLTNIKKDGTFEKIAEKWALHFNMNWIVKDNMLQVNYK